MARASDEAAGRTASTSGLRAGIRPATGDDAATITRLIRRSKASWGYDADLMAAFAPELQMTPADIARDHVEVLEHEGRLVAVYRLMRDRQLVWLEDLFVEPAEHGRGLGRFLFERACSVAQGWGFATLQVDSDPFAEGFYVAMGCRRVGMIDSDLVPGRQLPRLLLSLP